MFERLKRLFRNSLIYALGKILSRATHLISMPVLTRYLAPGEYGILSVISSVTTALSFIYHLGLTASSTRYYYDLDSENQRKSYFSSLFFFSIGTAFLLTALLTTIGETLLAPLLKRKVPFDPYMYVALVTLFFQAFALLPGTLMRVREQVSLLVGVGFARSIAAVALSIFFVVVSGLGALGPLLASLAVTTVAAGYFVYYLRPYLSLRFHWAAVRQSLYFGIPTISERLCWWVLNASNRIFLLHYVSLSAAGIYAVSHSMGVMLQLIGSSINSAWTPFFYATAREEKEEVARQIFSYTATYYTLTIVFFGLALAIFAREVFQILAPDRYLAGLPIIPWVILGAVLEAFYDIPSRGLYLMKRTRLLPLIMLAGAAVTTTFNFALIPTWGMMGAAWAVVLGYATTTVLTFKVSQRIYLVQYQYARIGRIFLAAGVIYAAALWMAPAALITSLLVKAALLATFPLALYATGFFEAAELRRAIEALRATLENKTEP